MIKRVSGGVHVAVRVAPRASRDAVQGTTADSSALKVAVTAAPEGGKANRAVIRLLAKQWRVPRTAISVAAGATGRNKVLRVAGDPDDLRRRLETWAETRDDG